MDFFGAKVFLTVVILAFAFGFSYIASHSVAEQPTLGDVLRLFFRSHYLVTTGFLLFLIWWVL